LAIFAIAIARESALALALLAAWFLVLGIGCFSAARTHRPDAPPTGWWTLAVILVAEAVLALAII
jgi:uncharacterized membrane protein